MPQKKKQNRRVKKVVQKVEQQLGKMALETKKPKRRRNRTSKRESNFRQKNYSAPLNAGVVSTARSTNKRVRFTAEARFITESIPSADATSGRVLVNRLFTPQTVSGFNFQDYCEIWAKYSLKKLVFRLLPDAPSTVTGRLMMAWVPDAEFTLAQTDPVSVLNQLRGTGVSSVGNYWTPQEIDVTKYLRHDRSTAWGGWYTNPSPKTIATEPYWISPGKFLLVCDGTASGFTGEINIAVDVCMDIEFWEPIVRTRNVPGVVQTTIDVSVLGDSEPFLISNATTPAATPGMWFVRHPSEIGTQLFNQATEILNQIRIAANLGKTPLPNTGAVTTIARAQNFAVPHRCILAPDSTTIYTTFRNSITGTTAGFYVYSSLQAAVADTPLVGVPTEFFGFGGLQLLELTVEDNYNPLGFQ